MENDSNTYKFQSIGQRYKGPEDQDLQLQVLQCGSDTLEVHLINKHYVRHCNSLAKQFVYLVAMSIAILYMKIYYNMHITILSIFLSLWLMVLLFMLPTLVKCEKFIYSFSFGLQLQADTFLGKSSYFIAASKIHDIAINEVLENFDFYYLLIVRTKQTLFHKKPIIQVFKHLKPSADCLHIIYKHLQPVMRTTSSQTLIQ